MVDEADEIRNELEIPKDFFILGGRQSYVIDATGTVTCVHNNQFDTDSHVTVTLDAARRAAGRLWLAVRAAKVRAAGVPGH